MATPLQRTAVGLILCSSLIAVEWPEVPDPIGMGPRLALIDWLQERGWRAPAGTTPTDDEIIRAWQERQPVDTIRNRKHLAKVATESPAAANLGRGSGEYHAAWVGDWATADKDWTDAPNLATWQIRLEFRAPGQDARRESAGGTIIVRCPEAEAEARRWTISISDGRSGRDVGVTSGERRWELPLRDPPVQEIDVTATASDGARRVWRCRFVVGR